MAPVSVLHPLVKAAFFSHFAMNDMQRQVCPAILEGQNVFITAGTGSGKTEAALAPVVSRYWQVAVDDDVAMPVICVVPTKALANDLFKRLEIPVEQLHLRLGIRHGDRDDVQLVHSPNILITTPESLEVLLIRNDRHLAGVRAVIIDEMHLFYNTQRGLQLSIELRRLARVVGHDLQIVALSATVADLGFVRDFFLGEGAPAELFTFSTDRPIDAVIKRTESTEGLLDLTEMMMSANGGAVKYLMFADSRKGCEQLSQILSRKPQLSSAVSTHYSSLSPEVRQHVEQRFNQERRGLCIATSTLELGIDVGDIDAICLWEPPSGVESFLQRVGRGNRRSSKTNAICLVPASPSSSTSLLEWQGMTLPEPILATLAYVTLLRLARHGRLEQTRPFHLYGAVVQQIMALLLEKGTWVRTVDIVQLMGHLPWLTRVVLESILGVLESDGYVIKHLVQNRWSAGENLYRLKSLRMIYGNFPIGSRQVDVLEGDLLLGEVPDVNLLLCDEGKLIRFNGRSWRVAERTDHSIKLTPTNEKANDTFRYGGERKGFDQSLVDQMWHAIYATDTRTDDIRPPLWRQYYETWRDELNVDCGDQTIPWFTDPHGDYHYLTCAGRVMNGCLAACYGLAAERASDFGLVSPRALRWDATPGSPAQLICYVTPDIAGASKQTLFQTLLPESLQLEESHQPWLDAPSTSAILARLRSSSPVKVSPRLLEPFGI